MGDLPRVFTVPASVPFLPAVVRAYRDGALGVAPPADPLALTRATLYLPTRRACRLARGVFLDVLGTDAAVLPRIVPLGDIDEDEFAFTDIAENTALDLPPELGGFARRALLARLVLAWARSIAPPGSGAALLVSSPAAALALADDLARLMDDFATRQVPWDRLDGLVPGDLDEYWQQTLAFLKIAREHWPRILKVRGAIEPAERRDRLIAAEAARLTAGTPGPVIAAGSTGSMPATAKLLATIARLPQGVVVLPGLDTGLDDDAWQMVGSSDAPAAGHPQAALRALLAGIGIERRDVTVLAPPAPGGRDVLASEAFRPAAATDAWRARLADTTVAAQIAAGLDGVALIEAANAEEEALAIAIALREAVERGETAALVTPDRALARRVGAALGRWRIVANDSGGDALAATPSGIFARLCAEVALGGLAPVPLLALVKHPLFRLGRDAGRFEHATAALERAVFRGPRPRAGSAALTHALAGVRAEIAKARAGEDSDLHRADPRSRLRDDALGDAAGLVAALAAALAPLETLPAAPLPLAQIAERHLAVVTALGRDAAGNSAAFAGPAGEALAAALEEIAGESDSDFAIAPSDYPEVLAAALASRTVRRPDIPGARVSIYGLLEARLTNPDCVVLGGLVEGVWPPEARGDPWLSRPMRAALGLDPPERRIGLTAHDFAQLLGVRRAVLARAAKVGGAPTVASRFLQRLAAVAGEARWREVRARGDAYLAWARRLDRPDAKPRPIRRPEPRPARETRPTALSVTEIDLWLRDPYSIYAKHILRLRPLDPIDTPPGARDRGVLIHGAIGDFTARFAERLPDDIVGELIRLGEARFAPLQDFPEARAFWWPRFLRIAAWFAEFERERRNGLASVRAEIEGLLEIPLDHTIFRLRARADRIERAADGSYAILDYKTGRAPTAKQVKVGIAPQLTLEGAMLQAGAFAGIPPGGTVDEFMYVSMRGNDPPGEPKPITWKGSTPDNEARKALARLTGVARQFENADTPYLSRERPMFARRYAGDYDHLARVKEWSLVGGAEDEESDQE